MHYCEVIVMLRQFWMKVTNECVVHIGLVWLHKEEASKKTSNIIYPHADKDQYFPHGSENNQTLR